MRRLLPLVLAAIAAGMAAEARQTPQGELAPTAVAPDHGRVPRADRPIRTDGHLEEPTWAAALAIELPFEFFPGENIPAPVRTVCLLTYDERYLHIGFRAYDPEPRKIRAHYNDRDKSFRNDYVGIVIDAFHDGRRGFNFMVNPLGAQMDASISDVGGESSGMNSAVSPPGEDFSWDAIWSSAARITAEGYEVEIAIPFASLRFPSTADEQTWGVVPFRAWPRDVMHKISATPRDRDRNCFFCQAGSVSGLAGMRPGKNLEFDPTITVRREDQRPDFPDDPLVDGPIMGDPGLSMRWGVTSNLNLNGALNPDFSQVEADAAQLSINRRFTLFYPEKRPFFLEGADFFGTSLRAVHTRAVADPDWGVKLTGKAGSNAPAVFFTQDAVTNLLFPGREGSSTASLEQLNTNGVARLRRDIGKGSAIGVLATGRQSDGYHNWVGGLDGYLRLSAVDTLQFQALRSETQYPEAVAAENGQPTEEFGGAAIVATYFRDTRNYSCWGQYRRRDEGLRADMGFIPQVGDRTVEAGFERIFWSDGDSWWKRWRVFAGGEHGDDRRGDLMESHLFVGGGFDGPFQSYFEGSIDSSKEAYAGQIFDVGGGEFFFNIRPTGDFTTSIAFEARDAIDAENVRPGEVLSIGPGLTYNLGRHFFVQLDHVYERFTRDEGWLYRANLTQARLVYQFNSRLFLRAILQRVSIQRNPSLYVDPVEAHEEGLYGQYLLSYKVNPQTVFFLGYSEEQAEATSYPRTLFDRTFFAKVGYAWIL